MAGCTAVEPSKGKATLTTEAQEGVAAVDPGFVIKAPNQSLDSHFAIKAPDKSLDPGFAVNPPVVPAGEINKMPHQATESMPPPVTAPAVQESRRP